MCDNKRWRRVGGAIGRWCLPACAGACAGAWSLQASGLTIGAWGDSITFGVGAEASGGYKGPLNGFIDALPSVDAWWAGSSDIWQTVDGEHLGMLASGGSAADRRNTNTAGGSAYLDSLSPFTSSPGTNPGTGGTIYPMRSLIYNAHRADRNANNTTETARWIEGYAANGLLPDAFLLHIGTNTISSGNQTNPVTGADIRNPQLASAAINTTNDPFANDAATQTSRVLQYIGNELDKMSATYPASSASLIYVARIIPMDNGDAAATDVQKLRNVIRYNYGDAITPVYGVNYGLNNVVDHLTITGATTTLLDNAGGTVERGGINDIVSGLSDSARSRVRVVDMFAIPVQDLIDTVNDYALGVSNTLALALAQFSNGQSSLIDNDADGYVDWVGGLDEGTVRADTLALASVTANLNLLLDEGAGGKNTHPTALGYEVMAVRWFQALSADRFGVVIPEPSVAVGLAGLVLVLRRRRGA